MPTIKLKLNGAPLNLYPLTPTVEIALAFLKNAPPDEIFETDDLATKLKIHRCGILKRGDLKGVFGEYTEKVRGERYWGSAAAIAELRKQVRS